MNDTYNMSDLYPYGYHREELIFDPDNATTTMIDDQAPVVIITAPADCRRIMISSAGYVSIKGALISELTSIDVSPGEAISAISASGTTSVYAMPMKAR